MKKQILAQFNNPDLILLSFLLFLITFLGIALWTYRKGSKVHYDRMARVPLDDFKNGGGYGR